MDSPPQRDAPQVPARDPYSAGLPGVVGARWYAAGTSRRRDRSAIGSQLIFDPDNGNAEPKTDSKRDFDFGSDTSRRIVGRHNFDTMRTGIGCRYDPDQGSAAVTPS
jgi:hypothetical protein